MKRLLLIASLVMGAATITCAKQHAQTLSDAINHAAATVSHLSSVYTDGKCHFRLKVVSGQWYKDRTYMFDPTKTNPNSWGFGFGCNAGASQEGIYDQLNVKRVDGKWIDQNFNAPFKLEQRFKVTKFAGKNWQGTLVGSNLIYGPAHVRLFRFCLVEDDGPQALCGQVQGTDATEEKANEQKIQQVLTVLKTIEFVDAPAQPPAPSSASSAH